MSKSELIAQLEAARWQMGREMRGVSYVVGRQFSVRRQLRASIRRQPSAWGVGIAVAGFVIARLLFGKKKVGKGRTSFYRRRHRSLPRSLGAFVLRVLILLAKPAATSLLLEKLVSPSPKN